MDKNYLKIVAGGVTVKLPKWQTEPFTGNILQQLQEETKVILVKSNDHSVPDLSNIANFEECSSTEVINAKTAHDLTSRCQNIEKELSKMFRDENVKSTKKTEKLKERNGKRLLKLFGRLNNLKCQIVSPEKIGGGRRESLPISININQISSTPVRVSKKRKSAPDAYISKLPKQGEEVKVLFTDVTPMLIPPVFREMANVVYAYNELEVALISPQISTGTSETVHNQSTCIDLTEDGDDVYMEHQEETKPLFFSENANVPASNIRAGPISPAEAVLPQETPPMAKTMETASQNLPILHKMLETSDSTTKTVEMAKQLPQLNKNQTPPMTKVNEIMEFQRSVGPVRRPSLHTPTKGSTSNSLQQSLTDLRSLVQQKPETNTPPYSIQIQQKQIGQRNPSDLPGYSNIPAQQRNTIDPPAYCKVPAQLQPTQKQRSTTDPPAYSNIPTQLQQTQKQIGILTGQNTAKFNLQARNQNHSISGLNLPQNQGSKSVFNLPQNRPNLTTVPGYNYQSQQSGYSLQIQQNQSSPNVTLRINQPAQNLNQSVPSKSNQTYNSQIQQPNLQYLPQLTRVQVIPRRPEYEAEYDLISNTSCAEKIFPYVCALVQYKLSLISYVEEIKIFSLQHSTTIQSILANSYQQVSETFGSNLVKELSSIDVQNFNIFDIITGISKSLASRNRNLSIGVYQVCDVINVLVMKSKAQCSTPFLKKFQGALKLSLAKMEERYRTKAQPFTTFQLQLLEWQIRAYLGIQGWLRTHCSPQKSHKTLRQYRSKKQDQLPPNVTIGPSTTLNPAPKAVPVASRMVSLAPKNSPVIQPITLTSLVNSEAAPNSEPVPLPELPEPVIQESVVSTMCNEEVRIEPKLESKELDVSSTVISEVKIIPLDEGVIDLTWIDDVDEIEILDDIIESKAFPFKVEEDDKNGNDEADREVTSPTDSGLGSPKPSQTDSDGCSLKCLCGNNATYMCGSCNSSMYCCSECQEKDWIYHQKWCHKMQP